MSLKVRKLAFKIERIFNKMPRKVRHLLNSQLVVINFINMLRY
jgi:hypothetical protein